MLILQSTENTRIFSHKILMIVICNNDFVTISFSIFSKFRHKQCSLLFSCSDQKEFDTEKVYFILHSQVTVRHGGKSEHVFRKAGTVAETIEECYIFGCSLVHTHLVFLYSPGHLPRNGAAQNGLVSPP